MSSITVPTFVLQIDEHEEPEQHGELRAGDLCPRCGEQVLDYDGLLNLSCPSCGMLAGGCFT